MAYVAISGNLEERTKDIISAMRRAEVESIPKYEPVMSVDSDFINRTVWKEYLHLKTQMPGKWLHSTENINVEFKVGEKTATHGFKMASPYLIPPRVAPYQVHEIPDTETDPEFLNCLRYYSVLLEIHARWNKVDKDVRNFLNSCKSLNEAVKLWPDVTMYINPEDINRMGVKREKARESEALAALASMDTDMLVGAAVISRMSQAAA